ncbi:cytochrome P450 [Aspergillus candidus]|uniref:Putative cytochrome P450 monooxygenase n=1 Tax=Aspergillus candidus TaxID=41067 RepID=A0A2I2FPA9_ASPCN|nr:putative cytochrome P450 monooxygenase [Aspergillus candidus]PLB42473.1 putative cytochrome P450 monooxygenase [Aspergillus candidus]
MTLVHDITAQLSGHSLDKSVAAVIGIIYNLYFHPLRDFPGPVLARATPLWTVYWELMGVLHSKTKEAHDRYGEAVRTEPNSLSYNSAQAWHDICGHRTIKGKVLFEKDQEWQVRSPDGSWHIVGANGEEHRRLRRLLAHAFSEKSLKVQEGYLHSYVEFFMSRLHQKIAEGNDVVDMTSWFNFMTFDVIGDLAFGEPFELLKQGKAERYLSSIFGFLEAQVYMRTATRLVTKSWLKFVTGLLTPKHLQDDFVFQYEMARDRLTRRVASDTDRQDFVYHMLRGSREKIGPDGLTFEEILTTSQLLILAGSETTSALLAGMLCHLQTSPHALSRLIHEIRSSFTTKEEISYQRAADLPYLHAVVEEALRIYPPVTGTIPRLAPQAGAMVCGRFVPGGTSLGMHHYSCNRSAANFYQPDNFFPERWLEDKDERFLSDQKEACRSFSHGPRNCLGKNLAYAEIKLIVTNFFWNFDIQSQPGIKNWADQHTNMTWKKKPQYVKLIPRNLS